MRTEDKAEFFKLLGDVMAGYGKALDAATMNVWFKMLTPFDPRVIRAAIDAYITERPDFAPAPIGIAARCKLLDGRPNENEAWAQAILSRTETATVVWTREMSEAFTTCQPLIEGGDEIGARMAFKDAYARLVAAARARNEPAQWTVSEGWSDRTSGKARQLVIEKAQRDGLLPAPAASTLLLEGAGKHDPNAPPERPEGLKRVLEAVAQLEDPFEKADRLREARIHAEELRKAEIAEQVRQYQEEHAK